MLFPYQIFPEAPNLFSFPSKPWARKMETAPTSHALPPVLLSPVLLGPDHLKSGLRVISPSGLQRHARVATCQLGLHPLLMFHFRTTECQGRGNLSGVLFALADVVTADLRKSPGRSCNSSCTGALPSALSPLRPSKEVSLP